MLRVYWANSSAIELKKTMEYLIFVVSSEKEH